MKTAIAIAAALMLAPATAALAHEHGQAGHEGHAMSADAAASMAAHETALRSAIEAVQTETIDYDAMVPELAEAVRAQEAAVTPMIQGYGAVQTVDHTGEQGGGHTFRVTFENAATDWMIVLNAEGKIAGMAFQPVP